jgi:hypothetical protein
MVLVLVQRRALTADLVMGDTPTVDPKAFQLDRFSA